MITRVDSPTHGKTYSYLQKLTTSLNNVSCVYKTFQMSLDQITRYDQLFNEHVYNHYSNLKIINNINNLTKHLTFRKNDSMILFQDGINWTDTIYEFTVMTSLVYNGKQWVFHNNYTSFGVEIDPKLFDEYATQYKITHADNFALTFGDFLSSKIDNVKSDHWSKNDSKDWVSDIRFGNVSLVERYTSCVNQFIIQDKFKFIRFNKDLGYRIDITDVLSNNVLFKIVVSEMKRIIEYSYPDIDNIVGIDGCGGYFAPVLAHMLNKNFIPIRHSKTNDDTWSSPIDGKPLSQITKPNVLIIDDVVTIGKFMHNGSLHMEKNGFNVVGCVSVCHTLKILSDCDDDHKPKWFDIKNHSSVLNIVDYGSLSAGVFNVPIVKKNSYDMTDLLIKRFQELPDFSQSFSKMDKSLSPLTRHKIPRKFTLTTKEWLGGKEFPDKLDNVRILYTEKDEQLAREIIDVLVIDQKLPLDCDPFTSYGVKINAKQFGNGETNTNIETNIRGCHVFVISRCRTDHINEDFIELCFTMDACNRSGVDKVSVILPYYPYSRSDKKDAPRSQIGAAVIAKILNGLYIENLVSVDLHAGQIQGFIDKGFHNLYFRSYISEFIYVNYLRFYPQTEWNDRFILIAPDAGSTKAIKAYSSLFKIDNIALDKSRSYEAAKRGESQVDKVRFIGDKNDFQGKIGIIIDDMIDTMGTMSKTVDKLVENGLNHALVFATHGVLSGPAMDRINNNRNIKEVVVSNTLPQSENEKLTPKLRIISIGEMVARAIDGIITRRSISRLFA